MPTIFCDFIGQLTGASPGVKFWHIPLCLSSRRATHCLASLCDAQKAFLTCAYREMALCLATKTTWSQNKNNINNILLMETQHFLLSKQTHCTCCIRYENATWILIFFPHLSLCWMKQSYHLCLLLVQAVNLLEDLHAGSLYCQSIN